ncbi:MAG: hypothetical protein OXB98_19480 [Bryobacterales bacterium]|nr:hypothetical protein [Bryobacterales bacterium]
MGETDPGREIGVACLPDVVAAGSDREIRWVVQIPNRQRAVVVLFD